MIPKVPQEARLAPQSSLLRSFQPMVQLLEENNMELNRSNWHRVVNLNDAITQPAWPEGIKAAGLRARQGW
ncbi:MAG: hypothetical protein IIC78_14265 [Chloroflexi bacterium]|nr:hypothetical protein [Chloroflexota bacterium]